MIFRRPAEVHDFAKTDDGASPKTTPVAAPEPVLPRRVKRPELWPRSPPARAACRSMSLRRVEDTPCRRNPGRRASEKPTTMAAADTPLQCRADGQGAHARTGGAYQKGRRRRRCGVERRPRNVTRHSPHRGLLRRRDNRRRSLRRRNPASCSFRKAPAVGTSGRIPGPEPRAHQRLGALEIQLAHADHGHRPRVLARLCEAASPIGSAVSAAVPFTRTTVVLPDHEHQRHAPVLDDVAQRVEPVVSPPVRQPERPFIDDPHHRPVIPARRRIRAVGPTVDRMQNRDASIQRR
jgi:hypothetical protein